MRCHFKIKNVLFLLPLLQVAHAAILPSVQNKQELDRLERQSNQYLIEEAKRTEALLQQQRAIRGEDAETGLPANSSWKFNVTRIEILDDHLFDGSPQREEIVQRYLGKDLGKSDIFTLVKELTDFYISRGYATTLISIDPGNIKSGTLKLRVLWGKINDFKVNGQTPGLRDSTRLFTAYPFAKDKILNMQDVDQGDAANLLI